ncbi:MAG: hypothetical protein ACE5MG_13235 [Candidatus Methylomirabilales bacterium]
MGRITWVWGVLLVLAGCASSPEVVMRSLPLAADARSSSASIQEVSLQEAGVSDRTDRIFLARVSLKNLTGTRLHFGPQDVYLAGPGTTLLYRISEEWLPKYYTTRFWGQDEGEVDRKAIPPFPSAEVKLGDTAYAAPPSTRAQREKVAAEMATLVYETFVRPLDDAPGTFMDKSSDVILGSLVKEVTLGPGDRVSGYVYFYRPAAQRSPYPLRVVIKLESGVHTFLFRE